MLCQASSIHIQTHKQRNINNITTTRRNAVKSATLQASIHQGTQYTFPVGHTASRNNNNVHLKQSKHFVYVCFSNKVGWCLTQLLATSWSSLSCHYRCCRYFFLLVLRKKSLFFFVFLTPFVVVVVILSSIYLFNVYFDDMRILFRRTRTETEREREILFL